jgi:hypothetical protein
VRGKAAFFTSKRYRNKARGWLDSERAYPG